jgi:hypothetical protein
MHLAVELQAATDERMPTTSAQSALAVYCCGLPRACGSSRSATARLRRLVAESISVTCIHPVRNLWGKYGGHRAVTLSPKTESTDLIESAWFTC